MLRIIPMNLTIGKVLNSGDNVMSLGVNDAAMLNAMLATGDHIYFTLMDARGFETVKYTHAANISLISGYGVVQIDRAQHNTARKSWPAGQCLLVLNTEGVLAEFVCQAQGAC